MQYTHDDNAANLHQERHPRSLSMEDQKPPLPHLDLHSRGGSCEAGNHRQNHQQKILQEIRYSGSKESQSEIEQRQSIS